MYFWRFGGTTYSYIILSKALANEKRQRKPDEIKDLLHYPKQRSQSLHNKASSYMKSWAASHSGEKLDSEATLEGSEVGFCHIVLSVTLMESLSISVFTFSGVKLYSQELHEN